MLGCEPERGVAQIEVRHHVGVAAAEHLGELDLAAHEQRDVGAERKGGGKAVELRGVEVDRLAHRPRLVGEAPRAKGGPPERRGRVARAVADERCHVPHELGLLVAVLNRLDDVQEVRVRPRQALAVLDERARQRVGALDRNRNGHHHVGRGHKVGVAAADARAAEDVHAVVDDLAHALRRLLLQNRSDYGRLLVRVEHGVGQHLAAEHD
mmetsp:Transcript_16577/g.56009  ORF Transcript_16577/g.56009 Transcript_16577/m.56009 type:complete len:210 (+) Transcript_16577:654-1283(+)